MANSHVYMASEVYFYVIRPHTRILSLYVELRKAIHGYLDPPIRGQDFAKTTPQGTESWISIFLCTLATGP